MGLFTPNISRLEKNNNISKLLKCLDHRSASVRCSAFVALAGLKDKSEEIIERLRDMLNDRDSWVQTIAVLVFADQGDASISDRLMEIIIDGPRNARIDLLKIITRRGHTEDKTIIKVIITALADNQEIVRRQAITAAGATRNRHLMPYLAENLHEKHYGLRVIASRAMYDIGAGDSVDYLISMLADNNQDVRAEARACLAKTDNENAHKALHDTGFIRLIKGMNGKEPDRRTTAQRIGKSAIREGLPLLHRACSDNYKGVRIEALKAIAVFKNPSSINYAAKLLHDKYREVRLEAVYTLEQIMDAGSREALKGAFDDNILQVADAARKAYGRMTPA